MKNLCWALPLLVSLQAIAEASYDYRVLIAGEDIGYLKVEEDGDVLNVDFDFKQNGRGPTVTEKITLDPRGFPIDWTISGTTTFGSAIDEYFKADDGVARWRDATGPGSKAYTEAPGFYINQNGSSYSNALLAQALLAKPEGRLKVYPGGEASIQRSATETLSGEGVEVDIVAYQILGLDATPRLVFLDSNGTYFGTASPRFALVRAGFEAVEGQMRALSERLSTDRYVAIQAEVAHEYDGPVRIKDVRIFDPNSLQLTPLQDVVVYGNRIASVQPADSPQTPGEVIIDGEGGTLVPGMYEMHGHIGQENALLNIAAGVTSVRDMGNENDVLEDLMIRINTGLIAGPRITRSCFIEGESEFASATGETVATLEAALAMVRWCGSRDFHQIKLYNSMRPEWAAALTAEAHRLGLRVAGHVPAFSTADAMIDAGFDEITHANQLMLGWVLEPGEDTRTLFRFTAMKRFRNLPLDDPAITRTVDRMVAQGIVHDPTTAIHEHGLTAIDGEPAPMGRAIIDHLPTNEQRSLKQELFGTESAEERAEYVAAFEFIMAILSELHDRGVLLVPGTDLGGSFFYHRELELFEQLGMTPAEVLKRASWDMAHYLAQDEDLGSIAKGKYADFFLVPGDPTTALGEIRKIRMVVSDGVVYFPEEIYPKFGIRPFSSAPPVAMAPSPGGP